MAAGPPSLGEEGHTHLKRERGDYVGPGWDVGRSGLHEVARWFWDGEQLWESCHYIRTRRKVKLETLDGGG